MEKRSYEELSAEDKKVYDEKFKQIAASYFTPYDDKTMELEIGVYALGLIKAYRLTREAIKKLEEADNIRFDYSAFSDAMMAVYISDLCDMPLESVALRSINSRKISILFYVISIIQKISDVEGIFERLDEGSDVDMFWLWNDTPEQIIKKMIGKE